ncbi:MAG: DNA repair protein RecO [bacterium]|nr:DNA repair protein RecO [bacterium]
MRDRTYSTEGVILARRNFGEADRLLTVFSRHYGKLRVIAKGIRRTTSRKRGSLELFAYVRLLLARGRNMDIVADVEVKNSFSAFRKDLIKVGVAYHLAEIVNKLSAEGQEHKEIFELLVDSLTRLHDIDYWKLHEFIQSFKMQVLEEFGFLERGKPVPKNLDFYIEDLINGELRTKKFLARLR